MFNNSSTCRRVKVKQFFLFLEEILEVFKKGWIFGVCLLFFSLVLKSQNPTYNVVLTYGEKCFNQNKKESVRVKLKEVNFPFEEANKDSSIRLEILKVYKFETEYCKNITEFCFIDNSIYYDTCELNCNQDGQPLAYLRLPKKYRNYDKNKTVYFYKNKPANGNIKIFFDNSTLRLFGNFENGFIKDSLIEYYQNGFLKKQLILNKNGEEINSLYFYENGSLLYSADMYKGVIEKYFKNGSLGHYVLLNEYNEEVKVINYTENGTINYFKDSEKKILQEYYQNLRPKHFENFLSMDSCVLNFDSFGVCRYIQGVRKYQVKDSENKLVSIAYQEYYLDTIINTYILLNGADTLATFICKIPHNKLEFFYSPPTPIYDFLQKPDYEVFYIYVNNKRKYKFNKPFTNKPYSFFNFIGFKFKNKKWVKILESEKQKILIPIWDRSLFKIEDSYFPKN